MQFRNWSLQQKLISVVSGCLFLQILISHPLWLSTERKYPSIPVFESIPFEFVDAVGFIFLPLLLVLLLFLMSDKANRYLNSLFFTIFILFIFTDINRLQVWAYVLGFMLFVLATAPRSHKKMVVITLQMIVLSIYFWSGIQKLNIYFVEDIFPWFFEPLGWSDFFLKKPGFAYFAAIAEIFAGIGLLFQKTRKIAMWLAVAMHIFILIILGPFVHNWNEVIWPWNIAMIFLLILLFQKNNNSIFTLSLKEIRNFWLLPFVIILFGVMPFFNFLHKWDEQLSFKMYSGVTPEGIFYYENQQTECIPDGIKEKYVHVTPNSRLQQLILDDWAFYELKIVPYKSKKRILQAGKKLCQCIENSELAGIKLLTVNRWDKSKDTLTTFTCTELFNN